MCMIRDSNILYQSVQIDIDCIQNNVICLNIHENTSTNIHIQIYSRYSKIVSFFLFK